MVALRGVVVRTVEERVLRSGERLAELDVRTERDDGPADVAPVVCRENVDRVLALHAGTEVVVIGRVRRRFFRSGGATQSRTEVVAEAVVPVRQTKKAQAAVAQVIATLSAVR